LLAEIYDLEQYYDFTYSVSPGFWTTPGWVVCSRVCRWHLVAEESAGATMTGSSAIIRRPLDVSRSCLTRNCTETCQLGASSDSTSPNLFVTQLWRVGVFGWRREIFLNLFMILWLYCFFILFVDCWVLAFIDVKSHRCKMWYGPGYICALRLFYKTDCSGIWSAVDFCGQKLSMSGTFPATDVYQWLVKPHCYKLEIVMSIFKRRRDFDVKTGLCRLIHDFVEVIPVLFVVPKTHRPL